MKCPICGGEATAEYVDIGVGMQQCTPFGCEDCQWVEGPICGGEATAEYVDIGVGMQQCTPFGCEDCQWVEGGKPLTDACELCGENPAELTFEDSDDASGYRGEIALCNECLRKRLGHAR